MYNLIELSFNYNLQQNTTMKVENDVDIESEENCSNIKSHEVYVPSLLPVEEIKSEVSLVLGVFIVLVPFLTHLFSASLT
jgi:hypothetical protein